MSISRRALILGGVPACLALTISYRSLSQAATHGAFEVTHTTEEWQKLLTPEQYRVLREAGTETPFTSPLLNEKHSGVFACAGCDLDSFSSANKYDSGTGWPSFFAPLEQSVDTTSDHSYGMTRTEVHCASCDGHLGHVFEDGPQPTGLRYCMNGVAMTFDPEEQKR